MSDAVRHAVQGLRILLIVVMLGVAAVAFLRWSAPAWFSIGLVLVALLLLRDVVKNNVSVLELVRDEVLHGEEDR